MPRSYTVTSLATAFFASICIVAICFIVDPYKLYPEVPGLSPEASADLFYLMRLHTPYNVERVHPSVLIMGNSRSAALPPQLLQKPGEIAYNASLPGATLREIHRMVEHVQVTSPLRQVLIGVDLPMFREGASDSMILDQGNRYRRVDPGLSDKWLYGFQRFQDYRQSLFSVNAMMDVWRILSGRSGGDLGLRDDGTWDLDGREKSRPRIVYSNLVKQTYESAVKGKAKAIRFDELDELLDFTEKNQIQTTLFILPMQGLMMNTIEYAGAWQQYRDWQRELVTRVDARNSGTEIYGVEDRPDIVLEAIGTPQNLFRDGVHFTRRAGIEIFTCFAGPCDPAFQPTRLDRRSIDAYLERMDVLRRQYAQDNSADITVARSVWLKLE